MILIENPHPHKKKPPPRFILLIYVMMDVEYLNVYQNFSYELKNTIIKNLFKLSNKIPAELILFIIINQQLTESREETIDRERKREKKKRKNGEMKRRTAQELRVIF